MKTLDWYGLYGEGWQNEIVGEAFSHPAKFSRALIRRIYEYAIERGWLAEGDEVLDPFAGVGLGAADALAMGLNWIGNELEQHFVDIGRGCECTGISKEDWRRCFGRWKRFAHRDGRHWCPQCLADAERVIEDWEPALPGLEEQTTSYKRNSGQIPHTEPHHYTGNLELFAKFSRNGARAVLLQGDSRELVAVLGGVRAKGIVASPPYSESIGSGHKPKDNIRRALKSGHTMESMKRPGGQLRYAFEYSANPRNLGNMREGDYAAVVSSPTYAGGCAHTGGDDPKPEHIEGGEVRFVEYGQSAGQLAAMAEGDVDAVISSPPTGQAQSGGTGFWEGLEQKHGRRFSGRVREGSQGYRKDQLGDSPGQLGAMATGDVDAVIGSPPYSINIKHDHTCEQRDKKDQGRGSFRGTYGKNTPGQLAAMPEGAFEASAVVSSPPYAESLTQGNEPEGYDYTKYGGGGQLAMSQRYGESPDNLGNTQGDTFWSAAKTIVQQCHQVLVPGGVAIWVLKAFVRNKQIVNFPDQWRQMCEACGFETLEWIRAWLVEDRGAQYALNGDLVEREVRRESFFRRLHRQKYPELSIDFEVVLVMRKAI